LAISASSVRGGAVGGVRFGVLRLGKGQYVVFLADMVGVDMVGDEQSFWTLAFICAYKLQTPFGPAS
jgi:hypothetical protein